MQGLPLLLKRIQNDEINWKILIPTLLELKEEIITYLKEKNFNLTYQKSSRQWEWILNNKDIIVQAIGLSVTIILAVLTLFPPKGK
jgi:hypothetical protein